MKKLKWIIIVWIFLIDLVFSVGCTKYNKPRLTTFMDGVKGGVAMVGGKISMTHDCVLYEFGLCWGTQSNPDLSDFHVVANYNDVGTYINDGDFVFICEIQGLVSGTTYHVRAYAINDAGVGYGEDVSFSTAAHGFVDLGLPSGTLWATCNVGSDTPEGYGDYFAWGETAPKTIYNWSTYKYCDSLGQITKYYGDGDFYDDGDGMFELLPEDDAAAINWGFDWRIPTDVDFLELDFCTTSIWTSCNGVEGRLFTASNGNSLFLPASGCVRGEDLGIVGVGIGWYLWTNSCDDDNNTFAWGASSSSHGIAHVVDYRCHGRTIRPVRSSRQD